MKTIKALIISTLVLISAMPTMALDESAKGFYLAMRMEYGFSDANPYSMQAGANYYTQERLKGFFIGGLIGWRWASHSEYIDYNNQTDFNAHFISITPQVGYSIPFTENKLFGLTPYAGIDCNIAVSAKSKGEIGSYEFENDIDKKTSFGFRLGATLNLYGFNLGASYNIPMGDNQKAYFGKDPYFAINIGMGF